MHIQQVCSDVDGLDAGAVARATALKGQQRAQSLSKLKSLRGAQSHASAHMRPAAATEHQQSVQRNSMSGPLPARVDAHAQAQMAASALQQSEAAAAWCTGAAQRLSMSAGAALGHHNASNVRPPEAKTCAAEAGGVSPQAHCRPAAASPFAGGVQYTAVPSDGRLQSARAAHGDVSAASVALAGTAQDGGQPGHLNLLQYAGTAGAPAPAGAAVRAHGDMHLAHLSVAQHAGTASAQAPAGAASDAVGDRQSARLNVHTLASPMPWPQSPRAAANSATADSGTSTHIAAARAGVTSGVAAHAEAHRHVAASSSHGSDLLQRNAAGLTSLEHGEHLLLHGHELGEGTASRPAASEHISSGTHKVAPGVTQHCAASAWQRGPDIEQTHGSADVCRSQAVHAAAAAGEHMSQQAASCAASPVEGHAARSAHKPASEGESTDIHATRTSGIASPASAAQDEGEEDAAGSNATRERPACQLQATAAWPCMAMRSTSACAATASPAIVAQRQVQDGTAGIAFVPDTQAKEVWATAAQTTGMRSTPACAATVSPAVPGQQAGQHGLHGEAFCIRNGPASGHRGVPVDTSAEAGRHADSRSKPASLSPLQQYATGGTGGHADSYALGNTSGHADSYALGAAKGHADPWRSSSQQPDTTPPYLDAAAAAALHTLRAGVLFNTSRVQHACES